MSGSRGAVYIVVGPRHNRNCIRSARSLRAHGFRDAITVVTDAPDAEPFKRLGCRIVDARRPGEDSLASVKYWRRRMYQCSPFAESLYMDADTVVLSPIDGLWEALKEADLAMALDYHGTIAEALKHAPRERKGSPAEWVETKRVCRPGAPYFNSGVIVWRRSKASARFFDEWQREWARFGDTDQFAVARALARLRLRPATLAPVFNDDGLVNWSLEGTAIFHYWAWKWKDVFSLAAHRREIPRMRARLARLRRSAGRARQP